MERILSSYNGPASFKVRENVYCPLVSSRFLSSYDVGVKIHKSLGVHDNVIQSASIVSAFTSLGCSFINAQIDGADKRYPAVS